MGASARSRLRAELAGATDPAGAVQRVEGSLQAFTAGTLDDDVAMLALAPEPRAPFPRRPAAVSNVEAAHG